MSWYWILRHGRYRRNPHGIVRYAEKAAVLIAADGLERLKKAETGVYRLLADCKALGRKVLQKWNKLRDLGAPDKPFVSPIPPEEYESLNMRIARNRLILAGFVVGEGFLNYLTTLVVIPGSEPLLLCARIAIALIVTLLAIEVCHWALESWDPNAQAHARIRFARALAALVTLLVIGAITTARARDFEGGEGAGMGIVGFGFIGISMILPIIGGGIDLGLARIRPMHRRVRKWKASLKDVRAFEGKMQADLKKMDDLLNRVETHIREHGQRMYAGITDFKVAKGNRDAALGNAVEDLKGTIAETVDSFAAACIAEFNKKRAEFEASIGTDRTEVEQLVNRSIEMSSTFVTSVPAAGVPSATVPPAAAPSAAASPAGVLTGAPVQEEPT